ncbi:MAG: DNA polymerase III subunit delta' [bacterium]
MIHLLGQEKVLQLLQRFILRDELPQSLLFTGPEGVGRKTAALWFAKALNCPSLSSEGSPCGHCLSCDKIARGIHPDVRPIEPMNDKLRRELQGKTDNEKQSSNIKSIKIDDIRHLQQEFFRKPLEGRRKVYIVTDAMKMHSEAASSFLKILEEPPPNVTFILVAESPSALLPTIVSRCQLVMFSLLPKDLIVHHLMEKFGISPEKAAKVASISEGSLGNAIKLLENDKKWDLREEALNFADKIPSTSLFEMIESTSRWAPEAKKKRLNGTVEPASRLAEEESPEEEKNETLLAFLEHLVSWFRDVLILEEGAPESLLINQDRLPILMKWRGILNRNLLQEIIYLLLESARQINRNANGRLVLQNVFVQMNNKLRILEEM